MPASATVGELSLVPLPNLIARQRLSRCLVDERPGRRDRLPGVAPLAAQAHVIHRPNSDRRALNHLCLRSRAYKRRQRHHRPRESCSVTIPASMTDYPLSSANIVPTIRPIRPAEAEAFSMMKIGRAPSTAATPLILRGFLLPQARDAAARRLSRKSKDPFAKTRYTYVYRSECAASPSAAGFRVPPQVQPELGSERHEDDTNDRRGCRRPRLHQSLAANQRLSFCIDLPL